MRITFGSRARRLLGVGLALALVATACGDDGDTADPGEPDGPDVENGEPVDEGEPQYGGTLVYGLEADTASPWTPQNSVCAISCHMVMRAIYDPLALVDENGEVAPYLAESIEPNDDFTEWRITPREGIEFHDGTAFDAEAIADNLFRHTQSFLTGNAILDIAVERDPETGGSIGQGEGIAVEDGAAVIRMVRPWTRFDVFLTGQLGYMASPTWLAAVDGDPDLATQPVGTGPFEYASFTPGSSFTATRNEGYWREGLPYLDGIEYRVLEDIGARSSALQDRQIDVMHTANTDEIDFYRGNDAFKLLETSDFGETNYLLLNTQVAPLDDARVRCALAHATDRETLRIERGAGIPEVSNGPFSPQQLGHLEDSGYPDFDPERARELIDEYEAEVGPVGVIELATTNDDFNRLTNQTIQDMWVAAGIQAELDAVEQGSYIGLALTGNFQAFAWRNHAGVDPDGQRFWWHSEAAVDPPGIALNFGRIKDDVIDAQLDIVRTSDDRDERREAAETLNRRFAEQCYNIWTTWTVWGLISQPDVNGLQDFELPDGAGAIFGSGIGGTHQIVQMWKG